MRTKKIKRKNKPITFVYACVKCDGQLDPVDWGGVESWRCKKCGMIYSQVQGLQAKFETYFFEKPKTKQQV